MQHVCSCRHVVQHVAVVDLAAYSGKDSRLFTRTSLIVYNLLLWLQLQLRFLHVWRRTRFDYAFRLYRACFYFTYPPPLLSFHANCKQNLLFISFNCILHNLYAFVVVITIDLNLVLHCSSFISFSLSFWFSCCCCACLEAEGQLLCKRFLCNRINCNIPVQSSFVLWMR